MRPVPAGNNPAAALAAAMLNLELGYTKFNVSASSQTPAASAALVENPPLQQKTILLRCQLGAAGSDFELEYQPRRGDVFITPTTDLLPGQGNLGALTEATLKVLALHEEHLGPDCFVVRNVGFHERFSVSCSTTKPRKVVWDYGCADRSPPSDVKFAWVFHNRLPEESLDLSPEEAISTLVMGLVLDHTGALDDLTVSDTKAGQSWYPSARDLNLPYVKPWGGPVVAILEKKGAGGEAARAEAKRLGLPATFRVASCYSYCYSSLDHWFDPRSTYRRVGECFPEREGAYYLSRLREQKTCSLCAGSLWGTCVAAHVGRGDAHVGLGGVIPLCLICGGLASTIYNAAGWRWGRVEGFCLWDSGRALAPQLRILCGELSPGGRPAAGMWRALGGPGSHPRFLTDQEITGEQIFQSATFRQIGFAEIATAPKIHVFGP